MLLARGLLLCRSSGSICGKSDTQKSIVFKGGKYELEFTNTIEEGRSTEICRKGNTHDCFFVRKPDSEHPVCSNPS